MRPTWRACATTRIKLEKDVDTLTMEKADLKALTEIVVFREIAETLSYGVDQYQVQDDMKATLTSVAPDGARESGLGPVRGGLHRPRSPRTRRPSTTCPTAWELAAFRATSVARYLIDTGRPAGRPRHRLQRGNAVWSAPNDTEAGRAQNRRVTFFLRKPEAVPAAPATPVSRPTQ